MSATATIHRSAAGRSDRLLRRALQGNGIFSALCGLDVIIASALFAESLGIPGPLLLGVGLALLPYGAALWWVATRPTVDRRLALTATVLDGLWVLLSAGALWLGWLPLTNLGWWAVLIVGLAVLVFADLQILGLRRAGRA